jgi:hypothetical protein
MPSTLSSVLLPEPRSHDGDELARLDGEVDVLQHVQRVFARAVALVQPVQADLGQSRPSLAREREKD